MNKILASAVFLCGAVQTQAVTVICNAGATCPTYECNVEGACAPVQLEFNKLSSFDRAEHAITKNYINYNNRRLAVVSGRNDERKYVFAKEAGVKAKKGSLVSVRELNY